METGWTNDYLKESPEEIELQAQADKLREEYENTPAYIEYRKKIRETYKKISEAFRKRINGGREKHDSVQEHKKLTTEEKAQLREEIKRREAEEFARMPQSYIEAVLAYNKLTDPALRQKFRYKTYNPALDEIPRHKNPKTTEQDISDLQNILVQDVIDFLNERGLQEVDTVAFHVDGLGESLKNGKWTSSSDSSIRFEGLDTEGEWPLRTLIGNYC